MIKSLRLLFFCVFFAPFLWFSACDCDQGKAGVCYANEDCVGAERCPNANKCKCEKDKCVPDVGSCVEDKDCPSGQICKGGFCQTGRCEKDEDCPTGKFCNALGLCEDKPTDTCSQDTECTGGKICCDIGNGKGKVCNFKKCLIDEDCRQGSKNTCVQPISCNDGIQPTCISGTCGCQAPCGGADCGSGKCCNATQDLCVDNPVPCPDLQCPPGFDKPDPAGFTIDPKSCNMTGPKCECVKKKPLELGENGLYSAIALFDSRPVVSGYNATYGDLVVGFQEAGGSLRWEFVDGVPANGTITGAPDGPRGGVSDKGDDVGLYTSIVVGSDKAIHVSYHDATNGTLKYALKDGAAWANHVVDKQGKIVGRFTSITLVGGNPTIAYFVEDDGQGRSVLRVAQAQTAKPKSDADWFIRDVTAATTPGCGGTCDKAKKEVCANDNGSPTCYVPTADADKCQPKACGKDQACVGGTCYDILVEDPNPPLPPGVGLFPSIATYGTGGIAISFYDNTKGDLKIALQENSGSPFQISDLKTKGDVGQFTSLVVDAQGGFHLSYTDITEGTVRYLKFNAQLAVEFDEVVDNGQSSPTGGESSLLADCKIALDDQGIPRIVYQDASLQTLKVASRQGAASWQLVKLAGDETPYQGAFGFFASQVTSGGTSYISNYKYNLRDNNSGLDLRTWKP